MIWIFLKKKEVIRCCKKTQRALPELCSPATPLGPTISSPLGSSSSHTPPTSSSNFDHFCACSTLWEKEERKKWQKSVGYVRWSHCTLFRDGTQHPSGPGWLCGKAHACFKISTKQDAILDFRKISSVFGHIRMGRSFLKKSSGHNRHQYT